MKKDIFKFISIGCLCDDDEDSNYILIRESCRIEGHLTYRGLYRSFTKIERPYLGLCILNSLNIKYSMLAFNYCCIEVI